MIDTKVFAVEFTKLTDWFSKEVSNTFLIEFKELVDNELTTEDFIKACKIARRNLSPHPSFFPSPKFLIDSVLGSLEDRALIDWAKITVDASLLSPVGRRALQAIGGSSTVRMSENPSFLKKDFVATFKAFSIGAAPDELRSPQLDQAIPISRLQARESA